MLDDSGAALLAAEFHHRVMNSFQVIQSLANRCGRVRDVTDLPPALDELSERLSAFAALHRQLANTPSGCFAAHCSALGSNLVAAFGRRDAIRVTMEQVEVPPEMVGRLALIVAELVTNCLKHSLTSATVGWISLNLRTDGDHLLLEVHDSADRPLPRQASQVSRIVLALAASLHGAATVVDRNGYCARVTLPLGRRGQLLPRAAVRRDTPSWATGHVPARRPSATDRSVAVQGASL